MSRNSALDTLNHAFVNALKDPTVIKRLRDLGYTPIGNSPEEFAKVIKTEKSRWYKFLSDDDKYDPDRLLYDQELLRRFYTSQGYADFRVKSAVAELTPKRDAFYITFTIEEGEVYKFGKVTVDNSFKGIDPESVNKLIETKEGETYNSGQIESTIDAVFADLEQKWGKLDFLVHAIGFSDKDELTGRYIDTSPDNFAKTMQISVYSFTSVARRAEKLMTDGGAMLTLTYYGAEKVMPNYNVMGVAKAALEASVKYLAVDLGPRNIRVNAISAGPIKTLAAAGIGDFRYILKWNEYNAPLKRTVTPEEVGDSGLYFLSDLSRGVTGEVHHVDSGYHVVGMKAVDAPDISVIKD